MIDKFLGMVALGSVPFWIVKGMDLMENTNRQPAFMVFVIAAFTAVLGIYMMSEEN